MAKYIDKAEVYKVLADYYHHKTDIQHEALKEALDRVPTVEAEPVKYGSWIFGETKGHSWMKCSECCVSQSGQTATFTYCPNCGAKMDEVEE